MQQSARFLYGKFRISEISLDFFPLRYSIDHDMIILGGIAVNKCIWFDHISLSIISAYGICSATTKITDIVKIAKASSKKVYVFDDTEE